MYHRFLLHTVPWVISQFLIALAFAAPSPYVPVEVIQSTEPEPVVEETHKKSNSKPTENPATVLLLVPPKGPFMALYGLLKDSLPSGFEVHHYSLDKPFQTRAITNQSGLHFCLFFKPVPPSESAFLSYTQGRFARDIPMPSLASGLSRSLLPIKNVHSLSSLPFQEFKYVTCPSMLAMIPMDIDLEELRQSILNFLAEMFPSQEELESVKESPPLTSFQTSPPASKSYQLSSNPFLEYEENLLATLDRIKDEKEPETISYEYENQEEKKANLEMNLVEIQNDRSISNQLDDSNLTNYFDGPVPKPGERSKSAKSTEEIPSYLLGNLNQEINQSVDNLFDSTHPLSKPLTSYQSIPFSTGSTLLNSSPMSRLSTLLSTGSQLPLSSVTKSIFQSQTPGSIRISASPTMTSTKTSTTPSILHTRQVTGLIAPKKSLTDELLNEFNQKQIQVKEVPDWMFE